MLQKLDGAMLLWLLGLLILSSLCSAMLLPGDLQSWEGNPQLPDTPTYRTGAVLPPNINMTIPPPTYDPATCDLLLNSLVPGVQIPLFCACWRCKGSVGPKGDHGDRGPPGAPGSSGIRGLTGFTGRPGFTGPPGIKGQKGDMGEKGQSGALGFTGTKGERGFKGDKGDQGLLGPPGPQGPQGETGVCPASCETIQGPPGLQGPSGPAGARGLPGVEGPVGAKGLKGDKGDMGRPGDPGIIGQKGDQGELGQCKCTDGKNGTDGLKGAKGEKGDTGPQGLMGSIGPKGNPGNTGNTGPPGPCSPTIQSAFSASIEDSFPRENHPIPFTNVITNIPGHFIPEKGVYIAPANGTYVFSFHLSVAFKPLKVGLFRNLVPIVRATEGNNQATSSHTVVLHLFAGDQVWLQVKSSLTSGIYTDTESSSTFSGYLLFPDTCDILTGRGFLLPVAYEPQDYSWDGPLSSSTTAGYTDPTTTPPHPTTTSAEHAETTTTPPHPTTTTAEHAETTTTPPHPTTTSAELAETTMLETTSDNTPVSN